MRHWLLRPSLLALAATMVMFTGQAGGAQDMNETIRVAASQGGAKQRAQRQQRTNRSSRSSRDSQRSSRRNRDRDARKRDGDRPEVEPWTTETQRTESGVSRATTVRDADGNVIGTREGELERTGTEDGVETSMTGTGARGNTGSREIIGGCDPETAVWGRDSPAPVFRFV